MRIIRSTASALVLAASLVGASAWAHGDGGVDDTDPKGATNTQGTPGHEPGIHNAGLKGVDQHFLSEAFDHSTEQLAIGELATRQGKSDEVKKIGAQIVTDETAALKKLQKVAEKNGLTMPKAPPAQDMATVARLAKLEGKQFDDAFLAQVRARDNHALSTFQQESKTGKNDDLKTYASDELAVIRGQLDQLKTGVTAPQSKPAPKKEPPKGTTNKQPSKK
jgi:putative membrane protein